MTKNILYICLAALLAYSCEQKESFIFAETDGTPHNTITPIARRRGEDYELDLVLRSSPGLQQNRRR